MKTYTENQVVSAFVTYRLPLLNINPTNKTAIHNAWLNYLDILVADARIGEKHAQLWHNYY